MPFGIRIRNRGEDKPIKLFPSKDVVLTTTETELELKPCRVHDDHKIEFEKKFVEIKENRPAHSFKLNFSTFYHGWRHRLFAWLGDMPKEILLRCYTCEKEGEITHDPNITKMSEREKMGFEKLIQLKATATKAEIAENIMAGLPKHKPWWEQLGPLIVLAVVVFLFLFAFQIQPNM